MLLLFYCYGSCFIVIVIIIIQYCVHCTQYCRLPVSQMPGQWSCLTDPTMLPCSIRSITSPGGVVGAAPSVEVLPGPAEPPAAPTLTSRLEEGLEVISEPEGSKFV